MIVMLIKLTVILINVHSMSFRPYILTIHFQTIFVQSDLLYIYIYIYTHTHTHTHTYIYIYIYIYIVYLYMYKNVSLQQSRKYFFLVHDCNVHIHIPQHRKESCTFQQILCCL